MVYRISRDNNALEQFNGSMKIVQQRSKQYKFEKPTFQADLKITETLMRVGISYKKKYVDTLNEDGSLDCFVFRGGIDEDISEEDVKAFYEAHYENFDEYAEKSCDIYKIIFPADSSQWKNATCTCAAFDVTYVFVNI